MRVVVGRCVGLERMSRCMCVLPEVGVAYVGEFSRCVCRKVVSSFFMRANTGL